MRGNPSIPWLQASSELLNRMNKTVDTDGVLKELGWEAPRPNPNAEIPFQNPLNVLLDDIQCELLVLKSKRPTTEQRSSTLHHVPISAMNDIMRLLGCIECMAAFIFRPVSLKSLTFFRPTIDSITYHG